MQTDIFEELLGKNQAKRAANLEKFPLAAVFKQLLILEGSNILKNMYSTSQQAKIFGTRLEDCNWIQAKRTQEQETETMENIMRVIISVKQIFVAKLQIMYVNYIL